MGSQRGLDKPVDASLQASADSKAQHQESVTARRRTRPGSSTLHRGLSWGRGKGLLGADGASCVRLPRGPRQ